MRAVQCSSHGPYREMHIVDLPAPAMIEGGVRIAVEAAGIGFANILQVAGTHQNSPPAPFIPGTEIAGRVLEVAGGVEHCGVGDRVAAAIGKGGYADEAVADARNTFVMPDGLDYASATHMTTIYGTAYGALVWKADIQPGEALLVHGAAGASGLAAVEIGKARGARVIATASSAEKLAIATNHGADHAINYAEREFRDVVLDLTDGRGADVIFDPVGGEVFDQSMRCIAPDGRLLPVGFAGGGLPTVKANILLVKNVSVHGLYWGYYTGWGRHPAPDRVREKVRNAMNELFGWFVEGRLKPVSETYPLSDFVRAMDLVAERRVIGKAVLLPRA